MLLIFLCLSSQIANNLPFSLVLCDFLASRGRTFMRAPHVKKIAAALCASSLLLVGVAALVAQEPPGTDRTVVIADFENDADAWKLSFKSGAGVHGYMELSGLQSPAHTGSTRYANVSFTGKAGNGLKMQPERPIRLDGYVRLVHVWVYGFGQPDELFLDFLDHDDQPHRLLLGRLDFQGWKRLTVRPPPHLLQRAGSVGNNRSGLFFRSLYLKPHFREKEGLCRLYVDTLEAVVRPYFLHPELKWRY